MYCIRPFLALALALHHITVVAEMRSCSEWMGSNIIMKDCLEALDAIWEIAHNPNKRPVHYSSRLPWKADIQSCMVQVDYADRRYDHQLPEQIFSPETRAAARSIIYECVFINEGRGGRIKFKGLQISIYGRFQKTGNTDTAGQSMVAGKPSHPQQNQPERLYTSLHYVTDHLPRLATQDDSFQLSPEAIRATSGSISTGFGHLASQLQGQPPQVIHDSSSKPPLPQLPLPQLPLPQLPFSQLPNELGLYLPPNRRVPPSQMPTPQPSLSPLPNRPGKYLPPNRRGQ
jgi:hypothetical protein